MPQIRFRLGLCLGPMQLGEPMHRARERSPRPLSWIIGRLVVLESGLGLESGLKSVFAGLGLGLGL